VDADRDDLRQQLAQRQQEKAELERQLHALRRRYADEVAPLEEEVLRLKVEHLRRAAQRHMRSAKHRNAYHDAQREYEAFRERWVSRASAPETVRERYRQAGKQCHPDVVPDAYREEAVATFQALEAAHKAGHARAVTAIAEALDRWGFPRKTASGDRGERGTRRPPEDLRRAVVDLDAAIDQIQRTEAYQLSQNTDDFENRLAARKRGLLRVLQELKRRGAS